MALPMRPEERLLMWRTGSMASTVGPSVTSTRFPCSAPSVGSSVRSRSTMVSGSAMRPLPSSPLARRPSSGSTTCTPRSLRVARFCCVLACAYMSRSMAGATTTSHLADR